MRSGYVDCDDMEFDDCRRWKLTLRNVIRSRRSQEFLKETLKCLEEHQDKSLIADELECDGEYCTLGVVGKSRQINMSNIDPHDTDFVSDIFDISETLVREIVFQNDEYITTEDCHEVELHGPFRHWESRTRLFYNPRKEAPTERYEHMINWLKANIK
jgi:hypothetical protein